MRSPAGVTVRALADAAQARPALAAMMREAWPGWYGKEGRGRAEADLLARTRRTGLPWGAVALEGEEPVGTAALAATSHGAAAGEWPWLAGLLVAPATRGSGVGSALAAACEEQARGLGAPRLLATTASAAGLLRRRGWRVLRRLPDEGLLVLAIELQGGPSCGAAHPDGPAYRAGT